jgi:predicted AlkP superfamily phosphohydrolase/phosphomutase
MTTENNHPLIRFQFSGAAWLRLFLLACFLGIACPSASYAYIGPGAGFVFASSFFALFMALALALFYFFTWPFRLLLRALLFRQRGKKGSSTRRVVILGLDGMDFQLTRRLMESGKLPHFQELSERGTFAPLATTLPAISPVAWSSFATGTDPSYHNIYDFLGRDPKTYLPLLSSTEITPPRRQVRIGKYQFPLGSPHIQLLRKSKTFWRLLGEHGIFSSILRVPLTFPPEKFRGVLLSGMCVPDLRGSQGTFSYFTSDPSDQKGETGGIRYPIELQNGRSQTWIQGPNNDFKINGEVLRVPLQVEVDSSRQTARFQLPDHRFELRTGTYSPWIRLSFRPFPGIKIHGLCLFYLIEVTPHLKFYISPLHLDPEKPALPIAHPTIYSIYLSKMLGPFATLGLAEDTWALNEGILSDEAFVEQVDLFFEERKKMFFQALDRTPRGVCACVFDTSDRIQHMFFGRSQLTGSSGNNLTSRDYVEAMYLQMDGLLGEVTARLHPADVLIVLSDHGFTHFKRGVNLNSWLYENGYLYFKDGVPAKGDWFHGVDWSRTRAYSLGLAGIYLNRAGREAQGIVTAGGESRKLKQELIERLGVLTDPLTGERAIHRIVDAEQYYSGPYKGEAPDLLVGYRTGYRSSWACATGRADSPVFEDNARPWNGDHSVDPTLVPGILFINRSIQNQQPSLMDIGPTVLKLFGIQPPAYMRGKSLV